MEPLLCSKTQQWEWRPPQSTCICPALRFSRLDFLKLRNRNGTWNTRRPFKFYKCDNAQLNTLTSQLTPKRLRNHDRERKPPGLVLYKVSYVWALLFQFPLVSNSDIPMVIIVVEHELGTELSMLLILPNQSVKPTSTAWALGDERFSFQTPPTSTMLTNIAFPIRTACATAKTEKLSPRRKDCLPMFSTAWTTIFFQIGLLLRFCQ